MKFNAPAHTTSVSLTSGTFEVAEDGTLTVPDDTLASDLGGLAVNGFVLANEPAAQPELALAPTKPSKSADLAPSDAN